MKVCFTQNAWEEFNDWLSTDSIVADRIRTLIKEIQINPFKGTGKPEPLKYELQGFWSRRIVQEHRLVYKISGAKADGQVCTIIQCKFHYDN